MQHTSEVHLLSRRPAIRLALRIPRCRPVRTSSSLLLTSLPLLLLLLLLLWGMILRTRLLLLLSLLSLTERTAAVGELLPPCLRIPGRLDLLRSIAMFRGVRVPLLRGILKLTSGLRAIHTADDDVLKVMVEERYLSIYHGKRCTRQGTSV